MYPANTNYPNPKELHVISVISNPRLYKSRPHLYFEFAERMRIAGVTFWTVESAYGPNRPFQVTDPDNPFHVQVRNTSELWVKEALVNEGINHLTETYPDWKYAAWIDADIAFADPSWAIKTIEELQRYDVVQPWAEAIDMGPEGEIMKTHKSFFNQYVNGAKVGNLYQDWHPGYAMAFTRKAYDAFGGFPEFCILGAGDRTTCLGLVGRIEEAQGPKGVSDTYRHALLQWQKKASRLLRNVGYVPGAITHFWHGKKANRGYVDRWEILRKHTYNPYEDIKSNAYGVIELAECEHRIGLRDDIRAYFRSRKEDSIDL